MIISLHVSWLADSDINGVLGWLLCGAGEEFVDASSSATVYLVLLWNMTGVAR